jgi:hypothetical protein
MVIKLNIYKASPFTIFITIMAQTKTGFQRITQFVASSTFVAGALAGGSLLNAGGAQAAVACSPSTGSGFTLSMVNSTAGTTPTSCALSSITDFASVKANFPANTIDASGTYRYSLSNAGTFTKFSLNQDIGLNQTGSYTKNVYSDSLFTNQIGTLTSTNGGSVSLTNLNNTSLNTIYVEDIFEYTGGTVVNSLSNNFKIVPAAATVPGPLPVIGAAMAFGYSRKLRSRIKSSV